MIKWHAPNSVSISTQLSPPEAIAVISSLSLVAATVYNVGFFAPTDVSLVYLLSAQDLLLGTSLAVLPVASALYMAMSAIRAVNLLSSERAPWWILPLIAMVCASLTYWAVLEVKDGNYSLSLNLAYFVLLALAAWGNRRFKWPYFAATIVISSIFYFVAVTGYNAYQSTINPLTAMRSSILLSNYRNIEGTIFRYTSGYIFLQNETFSILPTSEIVKITNIPRVEDPNG